MFRLMNDMIQYFHDYANISQGVRYLFLSVIIKKHDDTEKLISAPPLPTKSRIVAFILFFKYKNRTKIEKNIRVICSICTKHTVYFFNASLISVRSLISSGISSGFSSSSLPFFANLSALSLKVLKDFMIKNRTTAVIRKLIMA